MTSADPAQLEALAAAVSEGTFEAAARTLHVTPSAVSQRIKALEISVGRVLVTRTKPVRVTPAGEALLRLARQIATLNADVERALGTAETSHVVPLAVNADSLATWVLPALAAVASPLVFDLRREDESRTADLLRSGTVMAAVTSSSDPVPGCTVIRLGRMRYRATATAAFVERWFGDGVTSEALGRAPVVAFDREDRLQDRYLHRRSRRRLDPPRHYIPATADFRAAIRLGLGWGMVPDLHTLPELVAFDPRSVIDVPLFWQQWRLHSVALDEVATAVRAAAAQALT